MKDCKHINIEVINEVKGGGVYPSIQEPNKTYVICEDCGEHLNIQRITSRTIEI